MANMSRSTHCTHSSNDESCGLADNAVFNVITEQLVLDVTRSFKDYITFVVWLQMLCRLWIACGWGPLTLMIKSPIF